MGFIIEIVLNSTHSSQCINPLDGLPIQSLRAKSFLWENNSRGCRKEKLGVQIPFKSTLQLPHRQLSKC